LCAGKRQWAGMGIGQSWPTEPCFLVLVKGSSQPFTPAMANPSGVFPPTSACLFLLHLVLPKRELAAIIVLYFSQSEKNQSLPLATLARSEPACLAHTPPPHAPPPLLFGASSRIFCQIHP